MRKSATNKNMRLSSMTTMRKKNSKLKK